MLINNSVIDHSKFLVPMLLHLLCMFIMFSCSSASAQQNTNQLYRDEAISPIPLTVEVDQARASLGEKLFFDTRLSENNDMACITCHNLKNGGDDNIAIGISASADEHRINTPGIFNVRYNFRQNWNGSAETLQQQIETAINNPHEFNSDWSRVVDRLMTDEEMYTSFNAVYKHGITRENIIDAITEYEKTLITPNSSFDRYLRNEENSMTSEEIEGYKLFKELGCISCHQGINIGGNLFQKFGIFYDYLAERGDIKQSDYGKYNFSHREQDKFVFKVPSLRNVAVTAPYLHDGSLETLEEAIQVMGKTQLGRTLTDEQVSLISYFLHTLTGQYKNIPLDSQP